MLKFILSLFVIIVILLIGAGIFMLLPVFVLAAAGVGVYKMVRK